MNIRKTGENLTLTSRVVDLECQVLVNITGHLAKCAVIIIAERRTDDSADRRVLWTAFSHMSSYTVH